MQLLSRSTEGLKAILVPLLFVLTVLATGNRAEAQGSPFTGSTIPVMTQAEIDALTNPEPGFIVYNSTTGELLINTGTAGSPVFGSISVTTGGIAWQTGGNTLTGGEKLGSTNAEDLTIVTNNTTQMTIGGSSGDVSVENDLTMNNGTITANKTAAGSAVAINNTNGTNAIALNVSAGGGRTILSYGTGAGVIPTDVSVWNATGNVTLPGSVENGQILYIVNTSGGAITVTGVTGGTAFGFANNNVRMYVYAGGWFEMPEPGPA